MRMPILETERLLIRPFALDDLQACSQILDPPSADEPTRTRRLDWLQWSVMNYEELARLYQPPYGDRAVMLKATRELVGAVGLAPSFGPFGVLPSFGPVPDPQAARRNSPEMGLFWTLAPAHRGHGYATEAARALIEYAFRVLDLRRIVATTDYTNAASIAVMSRLGMRIEKNPYPEPEWFQVVGVLENRG